MSPSSGVLPSFDNTLLRVKNGQTDRIRVAISEYQTFVAQGYNTAKLTGYEWSQLGTKRPLKKTTKLTGYERSSGWAQIDWVRSVRT